MHVCIYSSLSLSHTDISPGRRSRSGWSLLMQIRGYMDSEAGGLMFIRGDWNVLQQDDARLRHGEEVRAGRAESGTFDHMFEDLAEAYSALGDLCARRRRVALTCVALPMRELALVFDNWAETSGLRLQPAIGGRGERGQSIGRCIRRAMWDCRSAPEAAQSRC